MLCDARLSVGSVVISVWGAFPVSCFLLFRLMNCLCGGGLVTLMGSFLSLAPSSLRFTISVETRWSSLCATTV